MRASRLGYASGIAGLVTGVGIALWSIQTAVIFGGAVTAMMGVMCLFLMPETGWAPRPRTERSHPVAELGRTAAAGAAFVRAQPPLLLLLGATFVAGASSEAFDRLWEAHFIRDVGLPAVGSLDPIVWFGLVRSLALALCALLVARAMRSLLAPVYMTWLNRQITDSSVRATVISIAGQADAVGQAAGGPALGGIGNAFGLRAALVAGGLLLAPALALYGRAVAHHGREPELAALPADAAV